MTELERLILPTPIGDLQILMEDHVIVLCEFTDRSERISAFLSKHYSDAEIVDIAPPPLIKSIFDAYFGGDSNKLHELPISPSGSSHQLKVWQYLQTIASGTTQSYGEMAKNLGSGPRAVGNANGSNNIAVIIPCHRVIGADGSLTGYAGGLDRKEWLLRHEAAIR